MIPNSPLSPCWTLQIPKHNSQASRGRAGWPLRPLLGDRSTSNPKSRDDLGVCPDLLPLSSPREVPGGRPLLTRPESRERGRRPGPRPAGTSSSSPPSSPCQEAAHPPRSSHSRGQDGGAGAGTRGWDRESKELWGLGSGSAAPRVPDGLPEKPTAAGTGTLHRSAPETAAAAAAVSARSPAPASSGLRRHCLPIPAPPARALAPCCQRPTAAAYSPLNSQSPAGPGRLALH